MRLSSASVWQQDIRGRQVLASKSPQIAALLDGEVQVVNIGLASFADELGAAGVKAVQLDWAPPAVADPRLRRLLAKLS